MIVIYCIILFLILYFIYLISKYSGTEEPTYSLQYFRDFKNIKYPTIVVGYLNDKTVKSEHFIATALDFACQGYIKVEQLEDKSDYIFTIIKNIKATELEEQALKIFFNNDNLEIGITQNLKQFKIIMKTERFFGNLRKNQKIFQP